MQERLRAVLNKVKDWWLKLNNTQRGLLIGGVVLIIAVVIVLSLLFGGTKMVILRACSSASEATEVRQLLQDNGFNSVTVDSNFVVRVAEADQTEAILLLGSNSISADGYTLAQAIDSSLTTTETVQKTKILAYYESHLASYLKSLDGITNASVSISSKDTSNNIFSDDQDYRIAVILSTSKKLTEEQSESIGAFLKTAMGNEKASSVFVMDSSMNTLYSNGTPATTVGSTAAQKVRQIFENAVINKASAIFAAAGFSQVSVLPSLDVNFDEVEIVSDKYTLPEGAELGLHKTYYVINSEGSVANASGPAGSESNDQDTTYKIENSDGSTSTYKLEQYEFYQDEVVTTTKPASGKVIWDNSSMAIVATRTRVITQEEAQARGELDNMTWDEFKVAHRDPVVVEVNEEVSNQYIELLAAGSGIPKSKITFLLYEDYLMFDKEAGSLNVMTILPIILAVMIAAALVFIVLRSLRPVTVAETEPELSVEEMLTTTKQQQEQVAEIDLQDKSETRKAIEKFVEENPESVALLLRNWLNEGWG